MIRTPHYRQILTLTAFFLYTIFFKSSSAKPLNKLFDYGYDHGDTCIIDSKTGRNTLDYGNTDDGVKLLSIPKTPYFHKVSSNLIQLSTNGYIVFGNDQTVNSPTPTDFPVNFGGRLVPMVAAFWTDFYFSDHSKFFYNIHNSGSILTDVKHLVNAKYPEELFTPTHAVKVTWSDVKHKQQTASDSFTFQIVIASNGKSSFVIFLYDTLPFSVKASVGFQENLHMYRYEYSMEPSVGRQLLQSSDVGVNGVRAYRIAEEVVDCSDKTDGFYSHPSDCEKYIVCANQLVSEIRQCNNSEHFHPDWRYCVPATVYPCNQELTQDCTGKSNSFAPNLKDCSKFVHCLHGQVEKVLTCPYGTVFNPNLKVCVHETQYQCTKDDGGSKPNIQQFCDGKKDGNYADPTSCSHYISCSNGLRHRMACGAGLHFKPGSDGLGWCDWPFNAKCVITASS